jgi:hypothetical protein
MPLNIFVIFVDWDPQETNPGQERSAVLLR